MAHWAENQLFVYLSLSVQLLLFIFQIKVVQCFVDTGLLALVNCILDFGWHVTLYAQIRCFGMGKKRRRAWNGKGEPPRPDTNRTKKKPGRFVWSVLLCLRCFRSGYPFFAVFFTFLRTMKAKYLGISVKFLSFHFRYSCPTAGLVRVSALLPRARSVRLWMPAQQNGCAVAVVFASVRRYSETLPPPPFRFCFTLHCCSLLHLYP